MCGWTQRRKHAAWRWCRDANSLLCSGTLSWFGISWKKTRFCNGSVRCRNAWYWWHVAERLKQCKARLSDGTDRSTWWRKNVLEGVMSDGYGKKSGKNTYKNEVCNARWQGAGELSCLWQDAGKYFSYLAKRRDFRNSAMPPVPGSQNAVGPERK